MRIIGLTGGIGTGKTEVCRIFSQLGVRIINADQIANKMTSSHPQIVEEIKARFGEHMYTPEGLLNRKKMGQLVFSNEGALRDLNHIVHPHLIHEIQADIQRFREQTDNSKTGNRLLIVEAALIYEIGLEKEFDLVIVVSSPIDLIVERLTKRDGIPQNEISNRINSQLDQSIKEHRADIIINNNSNINHLRNQVKKIYHNLT